jgi:hypothetical protein
MSFNAGYIRHSNCTIGKIDTARGGLIFIEVEIGIQLFQCPVHSLHTAGALYPIHKFV